VASSESYSTQWNFSLIDPVHSAFWDDSRPNSVKICDLVVSQSFPSVYLMYIASKSG
jgi:hypothetical protein